MPRKKQNFEETLSRLSDIVDTIDDGDTTLDDAIKLYKEGLTLAQSCGDILGRYEAEVLLLQKAADDTFSLSLFNEGTNANA